MRNVPSDDVGAVPASAPPAHALQLPRIDEALIPSFGVARRAVALVFGTIGVLLLTAIMASLTIDMNLTVDADGAMEQVKVWPIRPQVSGIVSSIAVATGDTVRRGDILIQLDTLSSSSDLTKLKVQLAEGQTAYSRDSALAPLALTDEIERVEQAHANLTRLSANLRERLVEYSSRSNVDSVLRTYVSGTNLNVDRAIADLKAAESVLRVARNAQHRAELDPAGLSRQRLELQRMRNELALGAQQHQRLTVRSPADGIVLTDQLERLAGGLAQAGTQILEVAEWHHWRAILRVGERDVHDVRVGQSASIEIPALKALDGRNISGRVVEVGSQPSEVGSVGMPSNAAGYRVVLELNRAAVDSLGVGQFRRGYAVRGRVVTRSGKIAALVLAYAHDQFNQMR